jgi:hypothetical protein
MYPVISMFYSKFPPQRAGNHLVLDKLATGEFPNTPLEACEEATNIIT